MKVSRNRVGEGRQGLLKVVHTCGELCCTGCGRPYGAVEGCAGGCDQNAGTGHPPSGGGRDRALTTSLSLLGSLYVAVQTYGCFPRQRSSQCTLSLNPEHSSLVWRLPPAHCTRIGRQPRERPTVLRSWWISASKIHTSVMSVACIHCTGYASDGRLWGQSGAWLNSWLHNCASCAS